MTDYISTTDTAKLIRKDLKAAFPTSKFSVRKNTGTASAWLSVSWEDGPTSNEVRAVADKYRGEQFNGQTDSYEDLGRPYLVSGITYHRHVPNAPTPQFTNPDAPGYVA